MTAPALLQRATFRTSRLLDFASEKELVAQTGHRREQWPLVILKELVDNALDACEEAGVAPVIMVKVDQTGITVSDNGPGMPAQTIKHVLDWSIRVSSREAYVSPTRGAQGNALKTIVAMPFVVDGDRGRIEIEAHGVRHIIEMSVDRIRQEPVTDHKMEPGNVKIGTSVKVCWPDLPCSMGEEVERRFLQIALGYGWINPHLDLTVDWHGAVRHFTPTAPDWEHWSPADPTSAHWYDLDRFERLIAAYLSHDAGTGRNRTIRELVAEFRGLSGSAKPKAVLNAAGLSRESISALVKNGAIERDKIDLLLTAMHEHSQPVKPDKLGVIGRDHVAKLFAAAGCEMQSFEYRKAFSTIDDDVPWVVEAAFAWCPNAETRDLLTGVNWSPAIVNPFRELTHFASLDSILVQQECGGEQPVIVVVHMATPRPGHIDRGKSAVVVDHYQARAIIKCVQAVTARWFKQRERERKRRAAIARRHDAMTRRRHVSIKEMAYNVMEAAYLWASDDGALPAKARQVMYAARGEIEDCTGRDLDSKYFTQTLLPDYVTEHRQQCAAWNVVYDARGHFQEPHTKLTVPLGTSEVRQYLQGVRDHTVGDPSFDVRERFYPTYGPRNRYGAILFIEKEGFNELFRAVRLAERHDLAIMSTKGMSVTAAREFIDEICDAAAETGVPIYVLHDFDKSGFSILGTLQRSARRYQFKNKVRVIDLGLRLEDIDGLATERVVTEARQKARANLKTNGATDDEIAFLLDRRVELNAFSSRDLVTWIERKLAQHGVQKAIPGRDVLADAYRRFRRQAIVQKRIDELLETIDDEPSDVPADITDRIQAAIETDPARPWDDVLRDIAEGAE
jgi:DNA topoisomerase VI subunit B